MLNWKTNAHGDNYLYEVNRELFASSAADTVLSRRFGSRLLGDDYLYVVVGTDSGLLLEFVSRHLTDSTKVRYIFVELDEVFNELLEHGVSPHPQVSICRLSELADCRGESDFAQFCFRDRVRVVSSMAAEEDFIGAYGDLCEAVAVSQTKVVQEVRQTAGSKIFLEKNILNAPDYLHTLLDIIPQIEGRDVLVLAGGPSLDTHIEWVKAHRERFVVLAVLRIAGVLAVHGIVPDFYAVIDPYPMMLNAGREGLAQSEKVPLLASYHANLAVVANWQSNIYFDGSRLPWTSELNLPSLLTAGPTVTHFALSIAVMASPRAIYLLGMDLCYGGQGLQSHCSHSSEAKAGPSLGQVGIQQVRTYAGELADADVHLLISADTAASVAAYARQKGISIFNLSDTAQVVEGIDYISSHKIDVASLRGSPQPGVDSDATAEVLVEVGDYLSKLKAEFEGILGDLKQLRDVIERRSKDIPRLFNARGLIRPKVSRQVAGIDDLVRRPVRNLEIFLKKWGAGYFLETVTGKTEDEITPGDLCAYYEDYYGAYLRTIAEVIETIEQALSKCDRRLQELSVSDLSLLAEQWEAENEPLRLGKAFLQPSLSKRAGYAEVKERLDSVFEAMLAELARADDERCRELINRHNVIVKAYYLYERRRQIALAELANFVRHTDDPALGHGLVNLLQGLRCELEDNSDEALREYEAVLERGDQALVELALRQILFIAKAIEDHTLSLQALECLEGFSKTYLKYHAEILIQIGNVREGLGKLADYHEVFPHDVENLIRIVEIYQSTGNLSQAEVLLEQIAAEHPTHPGVKRMKQTKGTGS